MGSFNEGRAVVQSAIPIGKATLKVFGDFDKLTNGWQPNTDYKDTRGGFRLNVPFADGSSMFVNYQMFLNQQGFGSPLPGRPAERRRSSPGFNPTTTTSSSARASTTVSTP